jgi:Uma2 family endonuclease
MSPAENETDRFERLAEAFREDTGFMAPGKSIPDAMGFTDEKGRWDAWELWLRSERALALRGVDCGPTPVVPE